MWGRDGPKQLGIEQELPAFEAVNGNTLDSTAGVPNVVNSEAIESHLTNESY